MLQRFAMLHAGKWHAMELMGAHMGCAEAACRAAAPNSAHRHACTRATTTICIMAPAGSMPRHDARHGRPASPAAASARLLAATHAILKLRQQKPSSPRTCGRGCSCCALPASAQQECRKGESRACLPGGARARAVVGGGNGCLGMGEHARACMQARGQACTAAQHSTTRNYRRRLTSAKVTNFSSFQRWPCAL